MRKDKRKITAYKVQLNKTKQMLKCSKRMARYFTDDIVSAYCVPKLLFGKSIIGKLGTDIIVTLP